MLADSVRQDVFSDISEISVDTIWSIHFKINFKSYIFYIARKMRENIPLQGWDNEMETQCLSVDIKKTLIQLTYKGQGAGVSRVKVRIRWDKI